MTQLGRCALMILHLDCRQLTRRTRPPWPACNARTAACSGACVHAVRLCTRCVCNRKGRARDGQGSGSLSLPSTPTREYKRQSSAHTVVRSAHAQPRASRRGASAIQHRWALHGVVFLTTSLLVSPALAMVTMVTAATRLCPRAKPDCAPLAATARRSHSSGRASVAQRTEAAPTLRRPLCPTCPAPY